MTRASTRCAAFAVGLLLSALAAPASAQDSHAGQKEQTPASSNQPARAESSAATSQTPGVVPVPALTDADRKAAFPDVEGHTVHDNVINSFILFDQLEWQVGNASDQLNVDARGWIGRDRDRLWFRAEGSGASFRADDAQVHVLYGRQFARWWDVVAGVRQDLRPGAPQTWAAFGIQGLAPYWFEIEATGYVGTSGRTHARFEVEYELLFTNRLILQPLFEAELVSTSDPERGVGSGLSTTDIGFRLRYEVRREVAPYVGVTWNNKWGKTADFATAAGEDTGGARVVTGLRLWF